MDLPDNVLDALRSRQKIKAIKLLREQRGIGLKEAKDIVDQYSSHAGIIYSATGNTIPKNSAIKKYKALFLGMLIIAAFVWAMVNLVEVVGSVIVLWHHDNYREATFVINKVHYNDDYESGLTWGFIGRLPDSKGEYRMYAPRLADAKALGYQKLRKMYPPGMHMKVWYNPTVTATLFQHRTLRIIPYTPDLLNSELAVIYHWLLFCLLPLVGASLFAWLCGHHTPWAGFDNGFGSPET
jgi:hypothetical protein